MLACIDVAYVESPDPIAVAACLIFETWHSDSAIAQYTIQVDNVADYVPGQFYKRELPPITKVLSTATEHIDIVVVDGYVQLGSDRPGLGQILYDQLNNNPDDKEVVVVGVAKKNFAGNDLSVEIFRGGSKRPLFVTSMGLSIEDAAKNVENMHGKFRLPTLLKQVDGLVREQATRLSQGNS